MKRSYVWSFFLSTPIFLCPVVWKKDLIVSGLHEENQAVPKASHGGQEDMPFPWGGLEGEQIPTAAHAFLPKSECNKHEVFHEHKPTSLNKSHCIWAQKK